MGDRFHGTHERAHGILTLTALDGHDALRGARHMQPGIRLQTGGSVCLCTRGNTGKTSDAFSIIGNYKVIHGLPYSRSTNNRMRLPHCKITIKETFCHQIQADFSGAFSSWAARRMFGLHPQMLIS
jgi:hypothetical protein